MAMDEVFAAQSREEMRRLFPALVRLDLKINTNADDFPDFARGVIMDWVSARPAEHLSCCSNPECRWLTQLDLVAVCRHAQEAEPLRPTLKERLFEQKENRHPVDLRLKCLGFVGDPLARNKPPCPNMFHVMGVAAFAI